MPRASRSNIEWRAYGQQDYGATHDLELGHGEWAVLREHLAQYGVHARHSCVDVGCGAGRLTNALAEDFDVVHALDVSPDRLRDTSQVPNADKVQLHLVDEPLIPLPADSVDLCISTHVMEHIQDMHAIESYYREMYRVLRPGGCVLIHMPVIGAHRMIGSLRETARRRAKESIKEVVLMATRRLMRMGFTRLPWRLDKYHVFSFVELKGFMQSVGYQAIECRILEWGGGHSYVFGKK